MMSLIKEKFIKYAMAKPARMIIPPRIFFISSYTNMCRAQLFNFQPTLSQLFGFRCFGGGLGRRQQKKPALQSYLESEGSRMPETKDMESSACYYGTQRTCPVLFRLNLRDSHFQTGGIATDYIPQIYTFFYLCNKKVAFVQKKSALLS